MSIYKSGINSLSFCIHRFFRLIFLINFTICSYGYYLSVFYRKSLNYIKSYIDRVHPGFKTIASTFLV
ncbi:MAG: hypothetical protein JWQ40_3811 [Segetibacter sp.]|nr:hypothetical protein [Segetibacter sp.]